MFGFSGVIITCMVYTREVYQESLNKPMSNFIKCKDITMHRDALWSKVTS